MSPLSLAFQGFEVSSLHVHAANGLDTNSGNAEFPFQTLNHALEVAWVHLHPPPGVPMALVDIKVHRSATPIAPSTHGGHEAAGWQTPAEKTAGITHKPFPIRLIPVVNVIGVPRSGLLPVIEIDEFNHGSYPTGQWEPGLPKALVYGASSCTLRGFRIDGGNYVLNRKNHHIAGVYGKNLMAFNVEDCEILDLYDGVFYHADANSSCTGIVRNSVLSGFFPKSATDLEPQVEGHAAIWLVGSGLTDVDVIDSEISESHDAIEIEGVSQGGDMTEAVLDIGGTCSFHDNENGLELVGVGKATVSVSGALFSKNANKENGTLLSEGSTSAIVVRGMTDLTVVVRDASFVNNGYSVLWGLNPVQSSWIDLGKDSDPGGNLFHPFDYGEYPTGFDPYRVHVFHKSPGGMNARIFAAGNTWITGMQGADVVTGCIDDGDVPGPANLPNMGINDGPPGPLAGPHDAMGMLWLRNYSILSATGKIEFGTVCP